jgi:hypothetical protein
MRTSLLGAAAIATWLSLLTACGSTPIEAVSDFNHQFDFSGVRQIALQPVDRADANAIKVSDMQINRINRALSDELSRRGYQMLDANSPEADLLMTWHLVTEERTDVRSYNSMSYYNCWRCGPNVSDVSVRQYTQGTFIVDMIDPASNRSVWRSIIQSRLEAQPQPSEERRREAAQAIFAEFPPG